MFTMLRSHYLYQVPKGFHHPKRKRDFPGGPVVKNLPASAGEVLAVGGGMKDGRLHILDISTGQSIQTPSTDSQVNVFPGVHLHSDLLESCETNIQ